VAAGRDRHSKQHKEKPVKTKVYGASDDLIEVEGGKCEGEVGCYGTDDAERGVLLVFSDGTLLEVKYGKGDRGIWRITLIHAGSAFEAIEQCDDEEAEVHSDIAKFTESLNWCYAATKWEKVN
jgi:hypothetical protein